MNPLKHLPNALTCGNLLCVCLGIRSVLTDPLEYAAYFVLAAAVFDFLDGFAARLVHVSSPFGKELDSLADVVSISVLPSMVLYALIERLAPGSWLAYAGFSIAIFSALRLARFNIDERQKENFIGLPVLADALFITALVFLPAPLDIFTSNLYALLLITFLFSFLMVSPLELFALKFKHFKWGDNQIRFTFLLISVLLLAWFRMGAFSIIILLYIAISLVGRVSGSRK